MNTFDHFIGKTTATKADNVDTAESYGLTSCNDIRRDIFTEAASALNHYMAAYMAGLMHQYIGTDNSIVVNNDFTCHLGRVADNTSVTDQCIVCYMHPFH